MGKYGRQVFGLSLAQLMFRTGHQVSVLPRKDGALHVEPMDLSPVKAQSLFITVEKRDGAVKPVLSFGGTPDETCVWAWPWQETHHRRLETVAEIQAVIDELNKKTD